MCSGCGRCGKVETGHHSVVEPVAPSVDLIQLTSGRRAPDEHHPCPGKASRSSERPCPVSSPMI